MKKTIIFLIALLFSNYANSLSIVYDGVACSKDTPIGETPVETTFSPARSSIEVIEHINDGVYRLKLHGGMPWYDDEGGFCIENRIFGVDGVFAINPDKLESTNAAGILNSNKLTVTYNSLHTNMDGRIFGNQAISSLFTIINYTYIFDYDEQNNQFILSGLIHGGHIIHTIGRSDLSGNLEVFETLTTTSDGIQYKPPNPKIKYIIEP
ncbi:MAG: hypothetical protein H6936_03170 [Burkholderiales bacterium]|nr:hypothetical protein [Burkholderiales bacterium]